jgi:predicted transposase YdaD
MSTTPHDTLIKAILGTPAHAATALRAILPASLSDALDWSALRSEPTEYVSVEGGSRHSDLLFSVPFRGEPRREALVYVLFEHQSTEDPLMALRRFVYVGRLFEARVLRAGLARVPLVIPVVLAHAERPWVGPLALDELYDAPRELVDALGPLVPQLTYLIEDVTPMSDEQIATRVTTSVLQLMLILLRDARTTSADIEVYSAAAHELLDAASSENGPAFLSLFEYLIRTKEGSPAAIHRVIASLPSGAQEDMVSAYDNLVAEWQAEYEAKSKAKNRAEGKAEGRRLTLAKQLQLKFGALSDDVRARLDAADEASLDLWTERILVAATLDELFGG